MSTGRALNRGLLHWSPFQHMVGESLCIFEFHEVDKACKSLEKRQTGVKGATPGDAGGPQQSHGQAARPCAGLCAASLWALPSGLGSALLLAER